MLIFCIVCPNYIKTEHILQQCTDAPRTCRCRTGPHQKRTPLPRQRVRAGAVLAYDAMTANARRDFEDPGPTESSTSPESPPDACRPDHEQVDRIGSTDPLASNHLPGGGRDD